MNLSKIVHTGHQNPRIGEARLKHQYQNPYIRRPNDQRQDMATALIASPGIKQSPVYTRPPQPPPSPPAEDPISLRTLPSIQSLIKMDTPQSSYDHQGKCGVRCRHGIMLDVEAHGPSDRHRYSQSTATVTRRRGSTHWLPTATVRSTNREPP